MLDSSIVGVVIGLIFIFSLMAILVTYINNAIIAIFNLRTKQLKAGLMSLIDDRQLQAKILAHPLIQMVDANFVVEDDITNERAEDIIKAPTTKVTWIAPSTFVEALKSILMEESFKTLFTPLQKAIDTVPSSLEKSHLREYYNMLRANFTEETLRKIYELAQQVPDEKLRNALLGGIEEVELTIRTFKTLPTGDLVTLVSGVEQIHNPHLKNALRTVLSTAQSLQDAETKMENWFNDGMSRATEVFKRTVQRYSLLAALALSVILNVDSLYLFNSLWQDTELRQSVTQAAIVYQQEQDQQANAVGDTAASGEASTTEDSASLEAVGVQIDSATETVQLLLDLQVPIGWQYTAITEEMVKQSEAVGLPNPYHNALNFWNLLKGNNEDWLSMCVSKLLGIFITTIAAAQGAPFWFDLLRKITSMGKG